MVVYRLERQDMTVTLTYPPDSQPQVELTMGSEVRTFPLPEFTHFWLSMIEMGRQETSAYLDSLGELGSRNRIKG
jgi:hypothetical protein